MTQNNNTKIFYRDGFIYQLVRNAHFDVPIYPKKIIRRGFISLDVDGHLILYTGYASDGPSGPPKFISRLMPKWLRKIYLRKFMRGAFAHDAIYELIRNGDLPQSDREVGDNVLRDICLEDKMNPKRADVIYEAVHIAAGPSADPANKKKIYEAP